jgi:hypothetical protein
MTRQRSSPHSNRPKFGGFGLGRRSPHCVTIAPEPSAAYRSRREAVTKRWAARG